MDKSIDLLAGVQGNDDERIAYRLDSSMLVLNGAINDGPEGRFHFQWARGKLRFLCRSLLPTDR
jgi:hypothetical protein